MFEDSVIVEILVAPFTHFIKPGDRLNVLFMASALGIAVCVYLVNTARDGKLRPAGLVKWLLPREVLTHPSCQADFAFFIVNRMLRAMVYGSVVVLSPAFMIFTVYGLETAWGPSAPTHSPSLWISLWIAFISLALIDFVLWYLHYLFHKIPFLWNFHKVHHSAEVMTPITAARMHPVEEFLDSCIVAAISGATYGVFVYIYGDAAIMLTMFDVNILLGLFFLAAFNLRHSHVWLRYPTWLQHILVCPAQHQIHHSKARHHWDKNMGFVFACWDWAFGTLYAPRQKEEIEFGLGTEEDGGDWHSLSALYAKPFQQSFRLIAPQSRPETAQDTDPG